MADQFVVPRIDFSWLSQLPEQFAQGEQLGRESAMRRALSKVPMKDGQYDFQGMAQAMMPYNPELAVQTLAADEARKTSAEYRKAEIQHMGVMEDIANRRITGTQEAADLKAQQATQKLKFAQQKERINAKSALELTNKQLDMFDDNAKSLQNDPNLVYSVGRFDNPINRRTAQYIAPGVQNFWNKFDSLVSQARANYVQQLKEASEKGQTGFGRILQQEWQNFGGVLAPIHLTNDPQQMKQSLQTIRTFIADSKKRIKEKYDDLYGGDGGVSGEPQTAEQPVAPGVTTTTPTNLPATAPPSAGDVPIQGARVENQGPGARPIPSPDKINLLRQYANDPEAKKAFDEIYGKGAADHFLAGGR